MAKGWKLNMATRISRLYANFEMSPGCWEWHGVITRTGYGRYKWFGRAWLAHRLVYYLCKDDYDENLKVCHHCDNRLCVNPDHMFLGTQAENVADCVRKGRHKPVLKYGADNPNTKLDPDKVREIRKLLQTDISISEISRRFNVSRVPIYCIRDGRTWKQVT